MSAASSVSDIAYNIDPISIRGPLCSILHSTVHTHWPEDVICVCSLTYRAAHSDGDGAGPGNLVRAGGAHGEGPGNYKQMLSYMMKLNKMTMDMYAPGDVRAELDADADGHDEVDEGDGVELDAPPVHQPEHVGQDHHDDEQDHQGGAQVHA